MVNFNVFSTSFTYIERIGCEFSYLLHKRYTKGATIVDVKQNV